MGGMFIVGVNLAILARQSAIIRAGDQVPAAASALVFGGGMKPDGSMSEMQEDRVRQGIELYQSGRVGRLIMTGDDGARRFDEVTAMRQYAIDNGVPEGDILVDPHGYRTYLSCKRAAEVYGVTTTIAISQSFHLPRIIYFCEHFGIRTAGVPADLRDYNSWWVPHGREILARLKGWLQITLSK